MKSQELLAMETKHLDLQEPKRLFKIINSNTNLEHFANDINNKYFNYIQSYRGDYYMNCITSNRGKNLISKLNINIAVSNYQGT